MNAVSGARKRLAIIGAGSSGLVTLKYAIDALPEWDICCFEKTDSLTGCWGSPHAGFKSTSTKYTTQFACFRKYDAIVSPEGERGCKEFFRDGEFGEYLASFVRELGLERYIRKLTGVEFLARDGNGWILTIRNSAVTKEQFDAVIVCTGLAAEVNPIESSAPILNRLDEQNMPAGKRIVVIGGGESGVDSAVRLADPKLQNEVYLSLASGIRVSPRYHPIAGVPSDFLRNRLLLSIHEDIRNAIGERFVRARMKYEERFERFFPSSYKRLERDDAIRAKKKYWSLLLTAHAKDKLFNMFHNKSDGFLDLVAADKIKIVGKPVDSKCEAFYGFDSSSSVEVQPDFVVPSIGYRSTLGELSGGTLSLRDFHLGCVHAEHDSLFLVGFARPIIGNIPSMSEMQAQYVTGILAGAFPRQKDLRAQTLEDYRKLEEKFPKLNTSSLYPVEMIPYCDRLASLMGNFPNLRKVGSFRRWLNIQLTPVSTLQYVNSYFDPGFLDQQPIHSPKLITALLLLVKLFDLPYSLVRGGSKR